MMNAFHFILDYFKNGNLNVPTSEQAKNEVNLHPPFCLQTKDVSISRLVLPLIILCDAKHRCPLQLTTN